ncbi:hypothetical protein DERP_004106 [Dermatophagoides pteronyssinus]|uniref:Uncharacterized protein n=1 Tax=Dermatophagoides pteronyssinus TaxID=6956 RepID=A0ABQ8J8R9_DERPT|nr:hypothetical protein DERP_004106 [Dermatophagoides pteronyssinus]
MSKSFLTGSHSCHFFFLDRYRGFLFQQPTNQPTTLYIKYIFKCHVQKYRYRPNSCVLYLTILIIIIEKFRDKNINKLMVPQSVFRKLFLLNFNNNFSSPYYTS